MRQGIFLKPLLISVLAAFVLCAISVLCLARYSIYSNNQHRQGFIVSFADSVEQNIAGLSESDLRNKDLVQNAMRMARPHPPHDADHPNGQPPNDDRFHGDRPPLDSNDGPPDREGTARGPRPPDRMPLLPPPPPHLEFWLVTQNGELIYSSSDRQPPMMWPTEDKTPAVHQIKTEKRGFFAASPGAAMIRLDREPNLFLMVGDFRGSHMGPLLLVQAVLTFVTVVTALFLSLSLTFYYLRNKSVEARNVLLRLERGDLEARFEIKRFDEFGGLLLDFNRMAGEIERLVARVHTTEATRNRLLQELGHDLRTPLTSLTTSFENLKFHNEKMTATDRSEAFEMIGAELSYLGDLLDKLMTISTLDEPHYRKSAELISVPELLQQEIKARKSSSQLDWVLDLSSAQPGDLVMLGDRHLILRLFKNSFDNASRYAKSKITVRLEQARNPESNQDELMVKVSDDGPGLSEADLNLFGKRREQRVLRRGAHLDISLGLGSVIMKAIVELHGGRIDIANLSGAGQTGAQMTVCFPLKRESDSSEVKVG